MLMVLVAAGRGAAGVVTEGVDEEELAFRALAKDRPAITAEDDTLAPPTLTVPLLLVVAPSAPLVVPFVGALVLFPPLVALFAVSFIVAVAVAVTGGARGGAGGGAAEALFTLLCCCCCRKYSYSLDNTPSDAAPLA